MNVVDYVILGVLGVSVLFGIYRGFVSSVLGAGGTLISFALAFHFSPKLTAIVQGNVSLQETLGHYTDLSSRIGDLDLALTNVRELGAEKIGEIVAKVGLPGPLADLLQVNLAGQAYAGAAGVNTVQDYVTQTVLAACINIICFVVCFAVAFVLVALVVNLLKAVFKFPVLKQLDGLAGGAFGLLRGLVICFALFALVPLVQTMVPLEQISELIEQSALAPLFNNGNLIRAIMNGRL